MRKASLFSGIGGIDLAAHWAGMETVVFCEREPFPQRVLRNHWPDVPIIDDVHDFNRGRLDELGIGAIDIVSAGYPCQPESHAGKRRGKEDDRWLWPEVRRVLEEIRPRWFVGENVDGHVSMGLDTVLADLGGADYTAQAFVIPAAAIGASHKRDRVFIVANTAGEQCNRSEHPRRGRAGLANSGALADTASKRCGEARERVTGRPASRSAGSSAENVADTESKRLGDGYDGADEWKTDREIDASADASASPVEDVADSDGTGCEELNVAAFADRSGHGAGCVVAEPMAHADSFAGTEAGSAFGTIRSERFARHDVGRSGGASGTAECGRSAQSRMGGNPHELSTWLDGGINPLDALTNFIASYPQPALLGQPQYAWEPPRMATGIKDRAARLKALGNAVDPLQIYPIMYAIKTIDDAMREAITCKAQ